MATAVLTKFQEPLTEEELAASYAASLVYKSLLEAGEPIKASEVARTINRPDVDLKLTRVVLATNPQKMTASASTNKWTLWTRFLDTRNTFDANLHIVFQAFGQPIPRLTLAGELAAIYQRPAEIYEEITLRLVKQGSRFLCIGEDYVLPEKWLLDTTHEAEEETLFENFLLDEETLDYAAAAEKAGLNPEKPETIADFLDAVGVPVKAKAVQFLVWRKDKESFDATSCYEALFLKSGAVALLDGSFVGPKLAEKLSTHFLQLAQKEVSESIEADSQEAAKPLVIQDAEREQLVKSVIDSDQTVYASQLLEDVFDITPDYRTYEEDLQTVIQTLAQDDRIIWVGGERFRPQGTIPVYVFSVPGLLELSEASYTDIEGNPVDQLLEDDGFDGGLEREILSPLAQDVLDEEPVPLPDPNPPSNARAVVKYHHKQIGTLPLCLFSSGFFPAEPNILETEFVLPGGQRAQVWVNNETRLLYGLYDWFQGIPIDSGATFTLERQAPDRYIINYNEESEPTMFISRNRLNELLTLQERADLEELPTYDIIREIMEHYRKGIEFLTLHTEVNIVRRISRRMVASILSEYHCFFQRGGAWVYDAKKLTQGFDKSKRKYLKK